MIPTARGAIEPPFERVEVSVDGLKTTYSHEEFMALQLATRIRLILAGDPTFYSGDTIIEKKKALALG